MMGFSSQQMHDYLSEGLELVSQLVIIEWAGIRLTVQSNSPVLLKTLSRYFAHCQVENNTNVVEREISIVALERDPPMLPLEFKDWRRETGKQGRKDSYVDLVDGRLLRKVRTDMVFLQSDQSLLAVGPCIKNDNQVINFIVSQIMNYLQQQDYVIGHAAAAKVDGKGVALAGFSGGGKSTLMLKLMDGEGSQFISNDRLFMRNDESQSGVHAVGVPKMPRGNPGTLLNNAKLTGVMGVKEQALYSAMPFAELWDVEHKYDVLVDEVYGVNSLCDSTLLEAVIILNWRHESAELTALNPVDIEQRQELLAAIKKAPGPFYQDGNGVFSRDSNTLEDAPYLQLLKNTQVWEMSGVVNVEEGLRLVQQQVLGHSC